MTQIYEQLLSIVSIPFVIQTLLAACIAAFINFIVGIAVSRHQSYNSLKFDHKAINQTFTIFREEFENYPEGYDLIDFDVQLKLLQYNVTNLPAGESEGKRSQYLLKSRVPNAPQIGDFIYMGNWSQRIKEIAYLGTFADFEIYKILVETEPL